MRAAGAVQYKQVDTHSHVESANPHQLITMLLVGALDNIAMAKGCLSRSDMEGKSQNISRAISIIGVLEDSLNREAGGELADNLANTYQYLSRRLYEANRDNDTELLDEGAKLLKIVKTSWDGIEQEANKAYEK
jgi:flagellar protein FliS